MAKYVDGFVIVVPKENLDVYKKMAKESGKVWKKYGALDYKECIGDDMTPEGVKLTFPKMAKAKDDEVIIFSYITYKSRSHRDQVNKKVMSDPLMEKYSGKEMPFDMKKFAYGGFNVIVDAR